jgi:hypothetical protein
MIGSTDTQIELNNTINTLKSYEAISEMRESSVVTHYLENSPECSQSSVNKLVLEAITLLCGLFSAQHERLDTQDLHNWLDYITISGGPAQMASLNFCTTDAELDAVGNIVSVATLAAPDVSTRLNRSVQYQATGIVPDQWLVGSENSLQMIGNEPIHYVISTDAITKTIKRLTKNMSDLHADNASRNARPSFLEKHDKPTNNGLIL